ncbi:hypothetical protein PENSPDRAFT_203865 [Peniophora sp. CONT]|nr:hypothetical protein PENSPDRAFT_203865 [Peniophora sp. CONT]
MLRFPLQHRGRRVRLTQRLRSFPPSQTFSRSRHKAEKKRENDGDCPRTRCVKDAMGFRRHPRRGSHVHDPHDMQAFVSTSTTTHSWSLFSLLSLRVRRSALSFGCAPCVFSSPDSFRVCRTAADANDNQLTMPKAFAKVTKQRKHASADR